MNKAVFKKGEVIFRQGDPGNCMYDIVWGSVGVYAEYGTPNEKKLAELRAGDFFGEMGLLEQSPRSATVVALENDTQVSAIMESDFRDYFAENPAKVFTIMQTLSQKLRRTTQEYLDVCRTVYETVEGEKKGGEPRSEELEQSLLAIYNSYLSYPFLDMY
ncbi:MAG: cyclic nucleotide-binding domain-containing protein [Firmicutes bacterium]|nr:cyclic nucleotide-binding domain-containing protein [Bacillota bacterium]